MYNFIAFVDEKSIRVIYSRLKKRNDIYILSYKHKFIAFGDIKNIETYQRNPLIDISESIFKFESVTSEHLPITVDPNAKYKFALFGNTENLKIKNYEDTAYEKNRYILFNDDSIIKDNPNSSFLVVRQHKSFFTENCGNKVVERRYIIENIDTVREILGKFVSSEKESFIFKSYFGIDSKKMTMKDIAEKLNENYNFVSATINRISSSIFLSQKMKKNT